MISQKTRGLEIFGPQRGMWDLGWDRYPSVLTCAAMGLVDKSTAEAGTAGILLMERAGAAVAGAIRRRWSKTPTLVLCGPGNNGGDGFVAARLLQGFGWPVRLAAAVPRDQLTGDAAHHAALWDGPIVSLFEASLDGIGLVVDALYGAGLTRPLDAETQALLMRVSDLSVPVVAVDIPSGVQGDTGADWGAVTADLTVTFERPKPGHLLLPGRALCGVLDIAPIGLLQNMLPALADGLAHNEPSLWLGHFPHLEAAGHKYGRGHAAVLGGWPMSGAARLSSRAALRIGAGLVSVLAPPAGLTGYASAMTSIILRSDEDFDAVLADRRINAMLLGPGVGTGQHTIDRALAMLATERSVVLDADALTSFAQDPPRLFEAVRHPLVLTPHEGEFQRLFGKQDADKLTRARDAAKLSGAVIVLKGADTVVAAPDGRAAINSVAAPMLATAGTGDVLAGMVTGLLAQSMPAFEAACAAVWIHAMAGRLVGHGLIAEDLPGRLPEILKLIASRRF